MLPYALCCFDDNTNTGTRPPLYEYLQFRAMYYGSGLFQACLEGYQGDDRRLKDLEHTKGTTSCIEKEMFLDPKTKNILLCYTTTISSSTRNYITSITSSTRANTSRTTSRTTSTLEY